MLCNNDSAKLLHTSNSNSTYRSVESLGEQGGLWPLAQVVVLVVIMLGALVMNTLMLAALRFMPKLPPKLKPCLISLALLGIVSGLMLPLVMYRILQEAAFLPSLYLCPVWYACLVFYSSMYMSHVLCICVVHYVEVGCPTNKHLPLKLWHVRVALASCWFISVGVAVGLAYVSPWRVCEDCVQEVLWDSFYFLGYMALLLAVSGVVLTASVFVHFYVHRHLTTIRSSPNGTPFISRSRLLQLTKAINITAAVFLSAAVLYHLLIFIHMYRRRNALTGALEQVLLVILLAHAFVCPVIYASKVSELKQAMHTQISIILCRGKPTTNSSEVALQHVSLQSVSKASPRPTNALNLHTTFNGRHVRMPRIVISDFDRHTPPVGTWSRPGSGVWYSTSISSIGPTYGSHRHHYCLHPKDHLDMPDSDL